MSIVQLTDVSVVFGERAVLDGVSLALDSDSRVALTGANGSGKTTLMRVIAGLTRPDEGSVVHRRDARISYLPQAVDSFSGHTVWEEAEHAFRHVERRLARRAEIGGFLAEHARTDEDAAGLLEEVHDIDEYVEASGYYDREARI
ncbi:MAG: ATP-binding cassette domain-containing protein, partial [Spirochaetaceae bacterium]